MTPSGLAFVFVSLLAQSPAADSVYRLALSGSESGLITEARARPLVMREAVSEAMARMVRTTQEDPSALNAARDLAGAYAVAWRDSFLIRQVERFVRWPPGHRVTKVRADSLRRAGVTAYSRAGPAAAISIWRRALAHARAIGDSAGMAGALDNIGAGLVQLGRLDSAGTYLTFARDLAAAIGDIRVEANAVGHLADLSADRGDHARAREGYAHARALRDRVGDTRGVAADINNLGLLAQSLGDADEARRQFEAALTLNRREGRDEVAATNLVNLAGLASLEGDFTRAGTLYRDALTTWRSREEWAEVAVALHGIGQLELRKGDYPAAQAMLLDALTIYTRTGPPAEALRVHRALADALAAAGNLQGALDQLGRAQRFADSMRAPAGARAPIALGRADLAVRLNSLAEAERYYGQAERLYRLAGNADGEAEARHGLGLVFLVRDDLPRAHTVLATALRTQVATGNRRAAALTRVTLGQVAWEQRDSVGARRQLSQATRELERLGDPVALAAALGDRAGLEAHAGLPALAESLYRAALRKVESRVAPEVSWQLRAGLALALRSRGDHAAAARELRHALDELERPSRGLALPERRSAFLADKWDVYVQLALTERARGLTDAAFEASERLRAREMLELLARGRVPAAPELAPDLVGREQDLRRRIAELTGALDGARPGRESLRGPDLSQAGGAGLQALLRAQEEYSDLLLRIRERAPRHAAFVAPRTASWRDVARRLAPDQALVAYLLSDSGSVAFVVVRDTAVAVPLAVNRRELVRLVEFVRGALELRRSDSLWRGSWRRLHAHLIAPLEESGLLNGKSRLVLVPHGELHYLPFAALRSGDGRNQFLGERYELSVTPSASVWLALGDRSRGRTGVGILAYAPKPDALPASQREVDAIQKLSGSSVLVRIGDAATEARFRREASTRRILHLATYGVLNKHNPLFSFVELAPGEGHDGRLDVHEVFGLSLVADLVVLSACQTALGSGALADVPAGDDWVGLTRAFLHAGAGTVVATLWPVDDWATAALMERFYEALARGASAARALAEAQRALRAESATADPFYWAGFILVGGADVQTR